jgi:hypothetical protein
MSTLLNEGTACVVVNCHITWYSSRTWPVWNTLHNSKVYSFRIIVDNAPQKCDYINRNLNWPVPQVPNSTTNSQHNILHRVWRNETTLSNTRLFKDLMWLDIPQFTVVQECVPGCIHSDCRPRYALNQNFEINHWLLLREIQFCSLSLIIHVCVLLGEKCKGRLSLVHIHLFLDFRRGLFASGFRIEFGIVRVCPVSTGNTFQDLPQLRRTATADTTERYILTWYSCNKHKYGKV